MVRWHRPVGCAEACLLYPTDIQRAARCFYLQHRAFAGKLAGQTVGTATTGPAINLLLD